MTLIEDGVELTIQRFDGVVERLATANVIAAVPPRLLEATVAFTPLQDAPTTRRWRGAPTWMGAAYKVRRAQLRTCTAEERDDDPQKRRVLATRERHLPHDRQPHAVLLEQRHVRLRATHVTGENHDFLRPFRGALPVAAADRGAAGAEAADVRAGAASASSVAIRPVQPVWCEAPTPRPLSPWKYSWNCR